MSATPTFDVPRNVVLAGDAAQRLSELRTDSVDCVVTSPPYFGLRDYHGGPRELGGEATVAAYVSGLRTVFRELARIVKPTGTVWLNLRDVYSRSRAAGAAPKGLLLAPERLLLALAEDGWLVRNRLVWAKRNVVPESMRDRLSVTHEDLFLLTRAAHYFFDLNAIRVPHTSRPRRRRPTAQPIDSPYAKGHRGILQMQAAGRVGHVNGKNPGSVWSYPTSAFRGAHFATFPEALIERPILAGCPERLCGHCGEPWLATYERHGDALVRTSFRAVCKCVGSTVPGLVLDPFFGSGTVGAIAKRLGRDWLGIELNADYRQLALARIAGVCGKSLGRPKPHRTSEQCGILNNEGEPQKEDAHGNRSD